jgi:hypothetical protein
MEAAAKIQSTYLMQCELGLADRNEITRGGMLAVQRMVVAYQLWLYKREFDRDRRATSIRLLPRCCQTQRCPAVSPVTVQALFPLEIELPERPGCRGVASGDFF